MYSVGLMPRRGNISQLVGLFPQTRLPLRILKTPLYEIEQSLHAYTRPENPDHVLDADSSLLTCAGKILDGLLQRWFLHIPTPDVHAV
jgi:hypothetical protein